MSEKNLKKKKIGVLMGGMSGEREISLKSGKSIAAALKSRGYRVSSLEVDEKIPSRLVEEKIEVAFIALHGRWGEDGAVQGMLEMMRIPYTGSGVLSSALAMNKPMAKKIFLFHRIPTPKFQILNKKGVDEDFEKKIELELPLVVKPAGEGSALGISIVHHREELKEALEKAARFSGEILIEEFIRGKEITVGILAGEPLPVIEIVPKSGFYDYRSKYTPGCTEYIVPAGLRKKKYLEAQKLGTKAYHALSCQGMSRADMIMDEKGKFYVLELNTIPGLAETSLLPQAAREAGIDFPELAERIVTSAKLKGD